MHYFFGTPCIYTDHFLHQLTFYINQRKSSLAQLITTFKTCYFNLYLSFLQPSALTFLNRGARWAHKMFDASAKIPRVGLLEGHQHFPGNFDSCLETQSSHGDDMVEEFSGKMCMTMGLAGSYSPQEAEDVIKRM